MRYFILALIAVFLTFGNVAPAFADSDPVYTSWRNNDALGGYDTVSFFSGKPQKGSEAFQTTYKGAIWSFTTQANLDLFRANPSAFAPQYGGYCAWALANGKLAKGSPRHWHVRDGRLYVNFNARIQKQWNKDIPKFIMDADARWPNILKD